MSFAFPAALAALLLIPYFAWLGLPRDAHSRGRAIAALVTRLLIALALIMGLAGLQATKQAKGLAAVFLIDASDSIAPAAVEQARLFAEEAIAGMGPDDQAAIIVFGADAVVERPMSPIRDLPPLQSEVIATHTDLDEAIRLGMALYPPGMARRMVILSDGMANAGDAEKAARLAAASGIQITALPSPPAEGADVLISEISLPTRLSQGQTFTLTIIAQSTGAARALLRVSAGSTIIIEDTVSLTAGENRFGYTLTAEEPGLTGFRAEIIPVENDSFHQNNILSAFTQVAGPPHVLIVSPTDEESRNLSAALLAAGMRVSTSTGESFPANMATLAQYQAIVLANTSGSDLGRTRMALIDSYVRDLGGGLVVIGGPDSYGPGGYYETALEDVLPVEMQIKDQERLPQMTVLYLIDKSGSMADTSVGGIQKVELAKEAILRALGLLGPLDRVGVISFDESATYLVPISPADSRDEIALQVASLRASGGTDIFAAVLAASQSLPQDESEVKHIVLLTDGGADPAGIAPLVEEMYSEHGTTLSVIAIGAGYAEFLEELPVIADGRFHFAYDAATIPEIFTEETILSSRAYIIEEPFTPVLTGNSYTATTIKPAATRVLGAGEEDPLLAAWQVGLGRAVAFTSDASGRWARQWLTWDNYARFWSQAVRWTIVEGASQNAEVQVTQDGETSHVRVDVLDDAGAFVNGLDLAASVIAPDMGAESVPLRQVGPGQYEGDFTPGEEGAYFIRVGSQEGGIAQTTGWVMSYSPEYRLESGDASALARITNIGGGDLIESAADVFRHDLPAGRAYQPIWQALVTFAAIALPLDIAIRRLLLTREDIRKAVAKLFPRRDIASAPERESRAGALFAAKEKAASRYDAPGGTPIASEQPPASTPATETNKKDDAQQGDTVSSLLAKKRERK